MGEALLLTYQFSDYINKSLPPNPEFGTGSHFYVGLLRTLSPSTIIAMKSLLSENKVKTVTYKPEQVPVNDLCPAFLETKTANCKFKVLSYVKCIYKLIYESNHPSSITQSHVLI